jgi:hypothetical protein
MAMTDERGERIPRQENQRHVAAKCTATHHRLGGRNRMTTAASHSQQDLHSERAPPPGGQLKDV